MTEVANYLSCGYGLMNSDSHLPHENCKDDFFNQASMAESRKTISLQLTQIIPQSQLNELNQFMTQYNSLVAENEINKLTWSAAKHLEQVQTKTTQDNDYKMPSQDQHDAEWAKFDQTQKPLSLSNQDEWIGQSNAPTNKFEP